LSAKGAKNPRSVFWAIALEVGGVIVIISLSRVKSEEIRHGVGLFSKPVIHYPVFTSKREKTKPS
jgi:hypothetical protein